MRRHETPQAGAVNSASAGLFGARRIWGEIPRGFTKLVDAGGGRLIVRNDQIGAIDLATCRQPVEREPASRFQGRRALKCVDLKSGGSVLIRAYHHGGIFRALTRDAFLTWPPRPFRELAITEQLRQRGVPTVEVYAACVEPLCGPFYRGWLVTRRLEEAQDLWAALKSGFAEEIGCERVMGAVAKSLRVLHGAGVYHADLNLKNILVRNENGGAKAYIIDLDKAKLFLRPVPVELAKRNLDRLLRSVTKLDPERAYFPPSLWHRFMDRYYDGRD
jgi:tRNA A-37 threonylcarbamoyl transferase component Bud32